MRNGDGVRLLMQTMMMMNQQRQDQKDAKFLANAFSPVPYDTTKTDTNYQFNDITGQGVKNNTTQSLLPTSFDTGSPTSAGLGQGLLQMMPQLGQGAMQMMPKQAVDVGSFANPMDKFSTSKTENQMTTTTTTKELGLPDIQKQIRAEWQKKVQADIKGMSAEGAQRYIQMAHKTLQDQLGEAKTDYNRKQAQPLFDRLNNAKTREEAAKIAMVLEQNFGVKANTDLIKAAYSDPDYSIQSWGNKLIAINKKNPNEKIDLENGKPMTDYERETIRTRDEGNAIRAANPGRSSSAKAPDPKKVGEWSTRYDEIMSDIWDSATDQERSAKINQYMHELNAIGQALDVDVMNDIDYITKTNPRGM
jgi:hypothetical protein